MLVSWVRGARPRVPCLKVWEIGLTYWFGRLSLSFRDCP